MAVHERHDAHETATLARVGGDDDQRLLVRVGAVAVPPRPVERPAREGGRPRVRVDEGVPPPPARSSRTDGARPATRGRPPAGSSCRWPADSRTRRSVRKGHAREHSTGARTVAGATNDRSIGLMASVRAGTGRSGRSPPTDRRTGRQGGAGATSRDIDFSRSGMTLTRVTSGGNTPVCPGVRAQNRLLNRASMPSASGRSQSRSSSGPWSENTITTAPGRAATTSLSAWLTSESTHFV